MDSFHEPRRVSEPIKLEDLTAQVVARSAEYHAKGIPLSGRIIHVCHYLPITATLQQSSRPGILSPPATPPHQPANIPSLPSSDPTAPSPNDAPEHSRPRWVLSGRQGHGAMISGIRSLSATHEQFIIGWTGDIESPNSNSGMFKGKSLLHHHHALLTRAHFHTRPQRGRKLTSRPPHFQKRIGLRSRRRLPFSRAKMTMPRQQQHMSPSCLTIKLLTAITTGIANKVRP